MLRLIFDALGALPAMQFIYYWLWLSPMRRPFEGVSRRALNGSSRILTGPLRGSALPNAAMSHHVLAQILGFYEYEVQRVLVDVVENGDTVYDIGAANGFYCLLATKTAGQEGRVYAFEPLPQNVSILQDVLAANGVKNCTIVQKAISSSSETVALCVGTTPAAPQEPQVAGMANANFKSSLTKSLTETYVEVQSISLDEFIRLGGPPPDVVKMDIEGAESLALEGASTLLRSAKPPTWVIEVHSRQQDDLVRDVLRCSGYQVRSLPLSHKKAYPRQILATRPSAGGR